MSKFLLFLFFLLLAVLESTATGRTGGAERRFLRSEPEDGSEDSEDSSDEDKFVDGSGTNGGEDGSYETCNPPDGGAPIRLWTEYEVEQNRTFCNMILYDKVYHLDEFIPIHKGGAAAIIRNCRKDATWAFENLQCIHTVPDHFPGVLHMCDDYIVGVVKGSPEDPCAEGDPSNWSPPEHPLPDFESCDVYDRFTCSALASMPNQGKWNLQKVQDYHAANPTTSCVTILYDWVFDLGRIADDGTEEFYKKHGNGQYPEAILRYCGKNMTEAFVRTVDQGRLCVPDHTRGGLNAVSAYVVGVVEGTEVDPCVYPPPTPCESFEASGMQYYSWTDNGMDPSISSISAGCPMVIHDKVYDVAVFQAYHPGGADEIREHCRDDVTHDFLEKSAHRPLYHLGGLQDYQLGVIRNGITDACGPNYEPLLDY